MIAPEKDTALLSAAARLPVAARYLEGGFESQTPRALCGPASVANVLRSLGEPADRATLLDCIGVASFFGLRGGTTLDQLAAVLRHKRRRVEVLRDLSFAAFREHLERSNDPARRYIANFHRESLFGWGGGHHSPLAGWLAGHDLALILDTNRRVGPWLVSAEHLHAAVSTVDRTTRKSRGLLLVE